MSTLDLSTEDGTNGEVRLALNGELDISSAQRVEDELGRIEAGRPRAIVLDLRELQFMDSTGLRTIVGADARAREQGWRLTIVRGPDAVQRIFSVTKLDERLEMVDDPAALGG
jgi:anti-anti-sigma factor